MDDDRCREIARRWAAGETRATIAIAVDTSIRTLSRELRKMRAAGWDVPARRGRPYSSVTEAHIRRALQEGGGRVSHGEIARQLGVPQTVVSRRARRLGIATTGKPGPKVKEYEWEDVRSSYDWAAIQAHYEEYSERDTRARFRVPRKVWTLAVDSGAITPRRGATAAQVAAREANRDANRRWALGQLEHERSEADRLEEEGFEVFLPHVVCDRVAVRDEKFYFVEFKKPGQTLRPRQQRIADLASDHYLIRYAEKPGQL